MIDERVLLIEGVVAERYRVGASVDQVVEDRLGDAEPAGRVLAVDHHEIEIIARPQTGQRLDHRRPARAADDITQKQ